jgi:phosphate transport system protein
MTMALHGDPTEGHTAKAFDQAFAELRLHTVAMGGLVIDQVTAAMRALLEGNAQLAQLVLKRESQVNAFDRQVDQEAFKLIALHQPMAGDLRMARAISRISVELERIGDEAKKIARFARRLAAGEHHGAVTAVSKFLGHMAELSSSMLRNAVRALDETDQDLASQVAKQDLELDSEFEAALRQLLTLVMEGENQMRATIDTVFALKGLERVGDHAKNIAEQVLFAIGAEDVLASA